jgi:hypothetical protein
LLSFWPRAGSSASSWRARVQQPPTRLRPQHQTLAFRSRRRLRRRKHVLRRRRRCRRPKAARPRLQEARSPRQRAVRTLPQSPAGTRPQARPTHPALLRNEIVTHQLLARRPTSRRPAASERSISDWTDDTARGTEGAVPAPFVVLVGIDGHPIEHIAVPAKTKGAAISASWSRSGCRRCAGVRSSCRCGEHLRRVARGCRRPWQRRR